MRSRVDRLRQHIDESSAFISFSLTNIRYLTGFTGSNGALVVSSDQTHLITDSRYQIQAELETTDVTIHIENDLAEKIAQLFDSDIIVYEANHLNVALFNRLQHLLPKAKFRDGKYLVEKLRIVKDANEIAFISQASHIATSALSEVINKIHVGMTEREIATALNRIMIDMGADDIAFETIVASGSNSAIAHHSPTHKEIRKGELLKIDFGAKLGGYHSDCTRTFCLGTPHSWQMEIHEAVTAAQSSGRELLHDGIEAQSVCQAVQTTLEKSGHAQFFTHGLGHGVGLEIHEDPFLSSPTVGTLSTGTVVTIEPGVYLPNMGGVRIEDTVVVTDAGYQNLTIFDYDLLQIG